MSATLSQADVEYAGKKYNIAYYTGTGFVRSVSVLIHAKDPLSRPHWRRIHDGHQRKQKDNPSKTVLAVLALVKDRLAPQPTQIERFLASFPAGEVRFEKPFMTKGLAFAFARREAPKVVGGVVRVERQTVPAPGFAWGAEEVWEFSADGRQRRVIA